MIPLEDNFNDVINKALRGYSLSDSEAAERAGLEVKRVQDLRAGNFDETSARKLAPVLKLNANALVDLANAAWRPEPVELPGLAQFNTVWDDMTVNSYLIWDATTKQAVAFDTGADCSEMVALAKNEGLQIQAIMLTHTHGDHIFDLDRLRTATNAPAFVSALEPLDGAESFDAGRVWHFGPIKVEARHTWGHAKGGITYIVSGLTRPVAVVGDAVFAASMGGGMISYADALRTNLEEIMTLPSETVICPGHGPLTTVGEERQHNPFLASAH
ncbi:MAG: MBL fold metallo-hydrolase [Chthoniobacteraceae bacterium]